MTCPVCKKSYCACRGPKCPFCEATKKKLKIKNDSNVPNQPNNNQ